MHNYATDSNPYESGSFQVLAHSFGELKITTAILVAIVAFTLKTRIPQPKDLFSVFLHIVIIAFH